MHFNYSFFTLLVYFSLTFSPAFAQNNVSYDDSFLNNGYQEFEVLPGTVSTALGMDRQPDGKLLTISFVFPSGIIANGIGVHRFNENGSMDDSFADDGLFFFLRDSFTCAIKDVHVLPNGKIILGAAFRSYFNDNEKYFTLLRLNADGSLDDSFGVDGMRNYDDSSFSFPTNFSTTLLPDGTLLVSMISYDNQSLFVVKFLPNGDLDPSFGDGGVATPSLDNLPNGGLSDNWTILLPSGGFMVATMGFDSSYYLTKFLPNGTIDPVYGSNGTATFNVTPGFYTGSIGRPLLLSSGKVVMSVIDFNDDEEISNYIFRANIDGSLDTSFGLDGYTSETYGQLGAFASTLHEMTDGSIFAAGGVLPDLNSDGLIAFFKYSSDGLVDESFGQNGYVSFPEQDAFPYEAIIAPANKVTICGDGYTNDGSMIARFNLEGISKTDEAQLLNASLQLSPNPATDHLNIQWAADAPIETIEILNIQGQLVQQYVAANQNKIVLPKIASGQYLLKIRDAKGRTAVQEFMKVDK